MKHNFLITFILGMAVLLSFPACNGIFEGIYDKVLEEDDKEFGFIEINKEDNSGVIYINATSYTRWTYINFHTHSIDSVEITETMVEPQDWDFAVHRYDAKTNGASVLETGFTGLSALMASGKIPEGNYIEDIWTEEQIAIDMSGMMNEEIKYAASFYNPELSKWLSVDISNMPPNYNPSNKVYVIKLNDGMAAAVRLKNFMDAPGIKGYMTIEYIYPLEF